MSRSPYFFLEKIKSDGSTELVEIRTAKNMETRQDLFPYNVCHSVFSIVEQTTTDEEYPKMAGIHRGLPFNVNPLIKAEAEYLYECKYLESCRIKPRWFLYSDLLLYLTKYPKVKDIDDNGRRIKIDNPLFTLKNRIDCFISIWDDGWDDEDDNNLYRIVYWIDY